MFPDVELGESVRIWLVFSVPALLAFPLVRRAFPSMPDGGWGVSRAVGIFLWTWLCWLPASITPIPYGMPLIIGAVAAVAIGGAWFAVIDRKEFRQYIGHVLTTEVVFLVVFLLALAVTPYNADLNHRAERYMDYAFMSRMSVTETFPPLDMWMSGKTVQYYYYGYVVMDVLRRVSGIELARFFNYALAGNYACFAAAAFGAGLAVSRRRWVGVATAALAALGSNVHAIVDWMAKGDRMRIDWFQAARVIKGTINEFPLFSYAWGDLHPYVIAFPAVMTVIAIAASFLHSNGPPFGKPAPVSDARPFEGNLVALAKAVLKIHPRTAFPPLRPMILPMLITSVMVGALFPTNSWDFPTFGFAVLMCLIAGTALTLDDRPLPHRLSAALWVTGVLAILCALTYIPFNLSFGAQQGGRGFLLVWRRSDMFPFVEHWAPFFTVIVTWAVVRGRKGTPRWVLLLVLGTLLVGLGAYDLVTRPAVDELAKSGGIIVYRIVYPIFIAGQGWLFAAALVVLLLHGMKPTLVRTPEGSARAFTLLGLAVIVGVEFVLLNDHYGGELERMNTVFKAYLQAWMLLCVGVPLLAVTAYEHAKTLAGKWQPGVVIGVVVVALMGAGSYAALSIPRRYRSFQRSHMGGPPTMDALDVFRRSRHVRGDVEAAEWVRENLPADAVILEATQNAYELNPRISTLTGRLSVIGWKNHEAGWRNSWEEPKARTDDVERIYLTNDLEEALRLCTRHGVQFIYIGIQEHKLYGIKNPAGLRKFDNLPTVYDQPPVRIIELKPASEDGSG